MIIFPSIALYLMETAPCLTTPLPHPPPPPPSKGEKGRRVESQGWEDLRDRKN